MADLLKNTALGVVAGLLYAGSLAVWPIYRWRPRGRKALRSLFLVFLVHIAAVAAWTGVEILSALTGGDWLHGLTVYAAINVLFLSFYVLAWWRGRDQTRDG
jgi:hypothetical protein